MSSIHDPRYKQLIDKLIRIRELKEVTQVELASRLKKPQSYVAKIENLDRRIDILELMDWLECFNSNIYEFLK